MPGVSKWHATHARAELAHLLTIKDQRASAAME